MKATRLLLRAWIALTSVAVFAASWVALAHSPKPNQFKASNIPAMPALPPIPSLNQPQPFSDDAGPQITMRQPMVRLRTGGS